MHVRKIETTATAVQWNRPGDAGDGDKPMVAGEGRLVVNYIRKGVSPNARCARCTQPFHAHGWLLAPEVLDPAVAHLPVDPDLGTPVEVPVLSGAAAPATTVDPVFGGWPTHKPKPLAPPVTRPVAAQDAVRPVPDKPDAVQSVAPGDARGLPVCPGSWIVTFADGTREVVPADLFPLRYAKTNPNESTPFTSRPARV